MDDKKFPSSKKHLDLNHKVSGLGTKIKVKEEVMRTFELFFKILEDCEFTQGSSVIRFSESEFENFCENAAKNSPPCTPMEFINQIIRRFSSKEGGETARDEKIALALLKFIIREKGLKIGDSLKRDLGNIAKEIKIPLDELKEFGKRRIAELVQETFDVSVKRVIVSLRLWADKSRTRTFPPSQNFLIFNPQPRKI